MFSFQADEALAHGIGFEDAEIEEDKETDTLEVVKRSPNKDSGQVELREETLAVSEIQQWLARVSWSPRRYTCNHISVGLQ